MKHHIALITSTLALLAALPCHAAEAAPAPAAAVAAQPAKAVDSTRDASFTSLEGVYEMAPEFKIKVWHEGARFMAQATGQPAFELFASGTDTFVAKVAPVKIVFKKDGGGKVTHFVLHQGGMEQIAKKTS